MSQFNPYSEWLGIQVNDKPTYYQLLDVSPSENDLKVILVCAKRQLSKLKAVDDDTLKSQRLKKRLQERIRRAAKCLTNPDLRKKYDARLIEKLSSQSVTLEFDALSPDESSIDGASTVHPEVSEPVTVDPVVRKKPSIARRYKQANKQVQVIWLSGVLGVISLVGIGYLVLTQTSSGRELLGFSPVSSQPSPGAKDKDLSPTRKASSSVDIANSETNQDQEKTTVEDSNDVASSKTESMDIHAGLTSEPNISTETQATPEPSAEQLKELGTLMVQAREALASRDFMESKRFLAKAQPLLVRDEDRNKFQRLTLLAGYVEEYWKALDQAWSKLRAGEELVLLGQRSMIVEASADALLLRTNGRNQTVSRADLPLKMQVALADSWFNETAKTTKVFRGAMMCVTPEFGPEKARELWRQAVQEGVELNDLELVIDDDYDLKLRRDG